MRYSNAPDKRPHLLTGWTLALIALVVMLIFALVFPRHSELTSQPGSHGDSVSVAYAELLLTSDPDNDALRLRLIEQLIAVGNLDRAEYHLGLLSHRRVDTEVRFLTLEAQLRRSFANPAGVSDQQRQSYIDGLDALLKGDLAAGRLQQLATLALAFNAPQLAALAYERLALLEQYREGYWLDQSARWYLAGNSQRDAARIYQRLAAVTRDQTVAGLYQLKAFDTWVGAGAELHALRELDQLLPGLKNTEAAMSLLYAGVRVARWRGDYPRLTAYLRRWQQLRPGDERLLEQRFAQALGERHLDYAWTVGRQLRERRKDDLALLRQMAQLGEWAGHPAEALPLWMQLARTTGAQADYDHAWRLAGQLFDFQSMAALLAELSRQRALQPDELRAFVAAYEALARPESARRQLAYYVQQHPQDRAAWRQLAQLHRNENLLSDEVLVWADMSRRHVLTESERAEWASLYWLLFQPRHGFEVLAAVPLSEARNPDFLNLRSALAWALERDEDAAKALERLREIGGDLSPDQIDMLLAVYRQRDPDAALALAREGWQRQKTAGRLEYAIQLALDLQRYDDLHQLLVEARPLHRQMRTQMVYWQGLVTDAEHRREHARLNRLLEQMLRRFPGQAWAVERYLWVQIDRRQTRGLERRLQAWRGLARQSPQLWLPVAAAYGQLGRTQESLRWYDRHCRNNPQDWAAQAAYADMLALAGRADSAWRLRRHLLAKWQHAGAGVAEQQPGQFVTYLRLLASTVGAQSARVVSERTLRQPVSEPLLEAWFERWVAQLQVLNQPDLIEPWLAWAQQRGLRVDDNLQLQSDLRGLRRRQLEQWLGDADLAPESRAEIYLRLGGDRQALAEALVALDSERPAVEQRTLRNQAQGVLERQPEGIQLGWEKRDFGGLVQEGNHLTVASGIGETYIRASAHDTQFSDSELLDGAALGRERRVELDVSRPLDDGDWRARLEQRQHDLDSWTGVTVQRHWALLDRDHLTASADWRVTTEETGLLRAMGARDSLRLNGLHLVSARDQFSWSLARNVYTVAAGEPLGDGWQAALDWSHSLLAHEPQWIMRSGVSWQGNQVESSLPDSVFVSEGGALVDTVSAATLLPERYGELYLASTWARGIPGALNRFWPGFTYKLELRTSWQWPESRFAYAAETGVGVEVLGDDELSLLASYNSAPIGGNGQAGGLVRLNYSLRFGR